MSITLHDAGPIRTDSVFIRTVEKKVCDLKAYIKKNDTEDLILESVNLVRADGDEVILKNLFGEEKRVRGRLREVSLIKNRLIVEQS